MLITQPPTSQARIRTGEKAYAEQRERGGKDGTSDLADPA
jgi:hypothetical protein